MSCHVCSRAPNSRLRFCCATCARSHLYQLRIEHARVLLEKGTIGKQIESAVAQGKFQGGATGLDTEGSNRWILQTIANKQSESSARTKAIRDQIEALNSEVKDKKIDISQRKLTLARRNSDAESAKYQLSEREATMLAGIQNNSKRIDHLWTSLHNKTAEARIFLCREAANIYGLRQKSKKVNGELKETCVLGGMPIIDLRDMNGVTPAQISTSFSNIAHLLVLISHYLSVRLPAEITLAHRNYPTPTIYAPAKSYLSREFAPKSPAQSSSSSPTTWRVSDSRPQVPRPRPLSVDRSLPKLAKEDPRTYALFLEGATLLAWNVSWLCRTQGLNLASDSWEEICDIGTNLWHLLVAPSVQASALMKTYTGRDIPSKTKATKDSPKTTIQRTKPFSMLGHYSHGTTHSFLNASEGTEFMRAWRLPTPTKTMDKLKSTLLGEMASTEWELLEEKEWDNGVHETMRISPVHKDELGLGSEISSSTATLVSTNIPEDRDRQPGAANERPGRMEGTSGWTKLRNR